MVIEAIIIKKVAVREHDLAVTLYSRELGKLTALAKSALKAHSVQGAQLDPANLIRCELVTGRAVPIITAAQARRCWHALKASPRRWAAAQFFLQVMDAAVYDAQQDEKLFNFLLSTFDCLEVTGDDQALTVLRERQTALLEVLGYGQVTTVVASQTRPGRTALDDQYEQIAQRKLNSLDLFYELA